MPHVGSEIDANFYRLIHQITGTPRDDSPSDARQKNRQVCQTAQRIAPWDGANFPDEARFVPIPCRDLTRSGFSFLTSSEPRFSSLVVEFGASPKSLYVAAQVMRATPVVCYPSSGLVRVAGGNGVPTPTGPHGEQGTPMFLVGCRFTRRLRRPT